ncbi:hypothetical protein TJA_19090 [Thermus sp. LT1-2-5]|uniref:dockerin type I repeat-containing protein n=1 Tax=Thermus sp. LT1-2-5 TaxID=3026935 RepID=UPI0030EA63FD
MKERWRIAFGLALSLFLGACSQPTTSRAPETWTLGLQGDGVRGVLVEATFDPSALRYVGAEGPYAAEAFAEAGKVRAAAVAPNVPSGAILTLTFEVLRPGAKPTVRVVETYPEGRAVRQTWGSGGLRPQALVLPQSQSVVQGITQAEADPSFVQNPLGDLNGNGSVSLSDGVLLADLLAGNLTSPTAYQRYHGDLNSSGTLTGQDLALLLRKIVNPALEANLELAPQDLTLNPGSFAYLLLNNSGNGALPSVSCTHPQGIAMTDQTPPGAAGKAYKVEAQGNTLEGSIQCQAGAAGTRTARVHAPYPSFTLDLAAPSTTTTPGGTATLGFTLTPENGFTGAVGLSLLDAPSGVSLQNPSTVNLNSPFSGTLTLSVGSGVAPGTYTLRLKAESGTLVREKPFALVVQESPGFDFYLDQSTLTLPVGGTANLQAFFSTYGGFSGSVNLALTDANGNPTSLTLNPASASLPTSNPVALTVGAGSATAGSYNLQVRAIGGSLTRTRPLSVTLYDFTVSANDITVTQGASGTVSVTLNRTHFSGPVSLSLSGTILGNGGNQVAYAFAENPTTGTNVSLVLNVGPNVAPGTYPLTLQATGGGLTRNHTFTLTVSAAPKALQPTLLSRAGNTYSVGVNLVGSTDAYRAALFSVTLPAGFSLSAGTGALTSGCTLDFAQVSTNPNQWNVALICNNAFSAPGQVAVLTVTGTGGGTLSVADVVLTKPDYTEDTSVSGGSLTLAP